MIIDIWKPKFKGSGNKKIIIEYIEYDIVGELLAIPNVISEKGIFYFILKKNNIIIKKTLDVDEIIERYYLDCLNYENNWMINEDTMPAGCNIIASSNLTPIVGFHNPKKKWYGVQFHPEKNYMHNIIFKNFVELCYERL